MKTKNISKLLLAAGGYLLLVRPQSGQRANHIKENLYAHRGLHNKKAGVPENTMAAFQKAAEAGYGIELDVQLTKDEQVVVFHDFTLKRVCGVEGDVSDYTYAQLQKIPVLGTKQRIPLLQDVLNMVDGKVPLLIEIKYKNFGSHVCEKTDMLLRQYNGEYVIESFHPWALRWFRKHHPEICRGQLAMNYQKQEGKCTPIHAMSQHLLMNVIGRPDFIAYDVRDQKAVSLRICRQLYGIPCAAWTVKSAKQMKKARRYFDAFIFEGFLPAHENRDM